MVVFKFWQIEVSIVGLFVVFDGYCVLQLIDIYVSCLLIGDWVCKVVDESNVLMLDLIVIIGDLIDGSVEVCCDDVCLFVDLWVLDGVVVIIGNYEYYVQY